MTKRVTLEDVAREFIAEQEGDAKLSAQLVLSCFMEKAKRVAKELNEDALEEFREKGLRRVK